MIRYALFEFTTEGGRGVISKWLNKNPHYRGATKVRVDALRQYGAGSEETRQWCSHEGDGIYKVKVRSTPEFRPHLCKGPFSMNHEATFLATAIEESFELDPPDVKKRAIGRRELLIKNPNLRTDLKI